MNDSPASSYLDDLPEAYRDDRFIGQFLLACEQILSGFPPDKIADDNPYPEQMGFEQYLDRLDSYFSPETVPVEFLEWLSKWVALSDDIEFEPAIQRQLIRRAVWGYRWRGTKKGLSELLQLCTGCQVEIYEFDRPRHYFQVKLIPQRLDNLPRQQAIARAIIDREKPAHTTYSLRLAVPTMRLVRVANTEETGAIVGRTTRFGTEL